MHAQVLAISWLLAGQMSPPTEFAPNVSVPRPGHSAGSFAPPALGSPRRMGTEEAVDLEPIPESSPGVEFMSRPSAQRSGNALRAREYDGASSNVATTSDDVARTSFANNRSVALLLVKHGLTPPDAEDARLPGQPASLAALLERVSDRGQRLAVIRAYWKLVENVARANWEAEVVEFTQTLNAENGGADRAQIESARLDSLARWQEARLEAVASQHELAQACRLAVTTGDSLPLPRDLPLVTAYTTKFERIFASRTPTPTVRQLAATIPLQFELVETRAASVSTGREALKEVRHAYQQGTADLALLLSSQHRLNESQGLFLQVVRRYNESVAAYALEIGGSVDHVTLVTMLIPSPTGLRAAPASQGTRTAAVPRSSSGGFSSGQTVRGPMESSGVRPTSEFAPAAPRGATSWGPATRSDVPPSSFEAPSLVQPPSRFGGP